MTFDLAIIGGVIVDGTGEDRFAGDVGVKDGVIVSVAEPGGLVGDAGRSRRWMRWSTSACAAVCTSVASATAATLWMASTRC